MAGFKIENRREIAKEKPEKFMTRIGNCDGNR